MASPLYHKLDTLRKEVRLLIVSPGRYEDPLACELTVVSLLERPTYHALSYCWGDEKETEKIGIGSEELPVTLNVIQALRRIRSNDAVLAIWIDAICINQRDTEERGHQVSMMVDVYSQAHLVHVWLGENFLPEAQCEETLHQVVERISLDSTVNDALLIAKQLATDNHLPLSASILHQSHHVPVLFTSLDDARYIEESVARLRNAADLLIALISQPWWQRVWVLQEVTLATADPILHFSYHTLRFAQLLDASANIARHIRGCCRKNTMDLMTRLERYNNTYLENLLARFTLPSERLRDMRDLKARYLSQKLSLFDALQTSRRRRTSDPRDHFYGILGLVESFYRSQININYEEDVSVTFSKATKLLTIENGSLKHLQFATGNCDDVMSVRQSALPSWVIDISSMSDFVDSFFSPTDIALDLHLFQAYDKKKYRGHWENRIIDTTTLFVHGMEVKGGSNRCYSTIRGKNQVSIDIWPWSTVDNAARETVTVAAQRTVENLSRWVSGFDVFSDTPTKSIKFWRWLLCGLHLAAGAHSVRRAHPDDLKKMVECWHSPMDHTDETCGVIAATLTLLAGREPFGPDATYFVTSEGHLGFGRADISNEHRLFIVSGVPTPVLLQPLVDDECSNTQHGLGRSFKFVGLCYLDGFMDGEAIVEGVKWETLMIQ